METVLIFIAGTCGIVWLTAFVEGAHLSKFPDQAEEANKMMLICIVSTVIAGISLIAYAAITSL